MNESTDPASDKGSDAADGTTDTTAEPSEPSEPANESRSGADESGALDGDDESAVSDGDTGDAASNGDGNAEQVPPEVRKYERFKKMDGARYERVNEFLRDRTTYITAREWAIARLCADFRTETGVEMTKIGENLPELVPFMTDTYTPQAVNQARYSRRR